MYRSFGLEPATVSLHVTVPAETTGAALPVQISTGGPDLGMRITVYRTVAPLEMVTSCHDSVAVAGGPDRVIVGAVPGLKTAPANEFVPPAEVDA